jgi:hypothetical protein
MDITKCKDDTCPLKDLCYRFTCEADPEMQSYFMDSPRDQDKCEMFWGIKSESILNQLKNITNGKEN